MLILSVFSLFLVVGHHRSQCWVGSTLALRTGRESQDANQNLDKQVLKWNGTYYTTILNCLPTGETSAAVSILRDGQGLAVGFPFCGKNGETTIVYKIHHTECDGSSKLLCFSFTTDEKPH